MGLPLDPATYGAFVITALLLALAPGTDNIYIATRTLSQGRRAGLLAAAGVALALTAHVTLITFGLSQLFLSSPELYRAVRWTGVGYLLWLAYRAFTMRPETAWLDTQVAPTGTASRRIVAQGFLLCLLNPKLAVFFIAFLPQFTDPAAGAMTVQLLILGVTFALCGLGIFLVMIFAIAPLGAWLRRHPAFPVWQGRLTGSVLGGMAVWLAFEDA
ncbi:MAG: LysE family translocator [Rhodospirillales bacterium]